MKKLKILFLAAVLCLGLQNLFAFNVDKTTIKNPELFGIQFPDGTTFFGNARSVLSISIQSYIVMGSNAMMTEIVIDIAGSKSQLRIYNAQLLDNNYIAKIAKEKAPINNSAYEKLVDNVNEKAENVKKVQNANFSKVLDLKNVVVKNYPNATHAHTLEYYIPDIDELYAFYDSITYDFTRTEKLLPSSSTSSSTSQEQKTEPTLSKRYYKFKLNDDEKVK